MTLLLIFAGCVALSLLAVLFTCVHPVIEWIEAKTCPIVAAFFVVFFFACTLTIPAYAAVWFLGTR